MLMMSAPFSMAQASPSMSVASVVLVVDDEVDNAESLAAVLASTTPVTVANHGVDHDRFTPAAERAADLDLLAHTGVAEPYVAFVGTIEPRKDVPALVEAFARIADAHPALRGTAHYEFHFHVIGRNQLSAALINGNAVRIAEDGFEGRVPVFNFLFSVHTFNIGWDKVHRSRTI